MKSSGRAQSGDDQIRTSNAQNEPLLTNKSKDITMSEASEVPKKATRASTRALKRELEVIPETDFTISKLRKRVDRLDKQNRDLTMTLEKEKKSNLDLTSAMDLAHEKITSTSEALDHAEQTLKAREKELEKIRKHEEALKCRLDKKVQSLQDKLKHSEKELKASQVKSSQLQRTEESLEETREKMMALQSELTACKDDLFGLRPAAPIPETDILKNFETIGQQIVNWIDGEVLAFQKSHPDAEPQHIFTTDSDGEASNFLATYPAAGEYLVRFLIHRFLQDHIFSPDIYLVGLPEETQFLLRRVEESMKRLKPPKDLSAIASWRSETLQALAATAECESIKQRQLQDINDRLIHHLGAIFPILFGLRQNEDKFFRKVILPAADLAVMMRTSAANYKFHLPRSPIQQLPPPLSAHLGRVGLVDIKSGKSLKPQSIVTMDDIGEIGNSIITLEPAIARMNGDGSHVLLQSQTVLIELFDPLERRDEK